MFRSQTRAVLRTPLFELKLELLLVLLIMGAMIIANTANAQSSTKTRKTTTTITTTTSEGEEEVAPEAAPAEPEAQDFLVTKVFGSKAQSGMAGCKTEELSQQVVRDLESQCNAWIKKQKGELKKKYQTGTCEEACSDCGMSLKRCTVTGTVHYAK